MVGIFCFLLQFDGLYGQDAYSYLLQFTALQNGEATNQFYPPVYPVAGILLNTLFHQNEYCLQWVSLISWWGSSAVLYSILKLNSQSRHTVILVVVSFLFCPILVRMGVLVMSDMLAMFLGITAIRFGIYSKHSIRFLAFFVLAALAVLTRYALSVLLLPTLLCVVWQLFHQKLVRIWILALVGVLIGTFLLWYNFAFLANSDGSLQHNWLRMWSFGHFFSREFSHQDGNLFYDLPNVVYVFKQFYHPKFFLLFLPSLFFIKKGDFESLHSRIVLLSILLYIFFLAGIPFQNERFLLPSFPLVILLFFPAMERLSDRLGKFSLALLFLLIIQGAMSFQWLKPLIDRNRFEKTLVKSLEPYQGAVLYSFDLDIALEGRGLKFNFRNLWKQAYPRFDQNALVLFNPSKFEKQWRGKNPMINWENLSKLNTLVVLLEFEQGWKLYQIKGKNSQ